MRHKRAATAFVQALDEEDARHRQFARERQHVLPPPPRSLTQGVGFANGGIVPFTEVSNTLEHPTGPEHQLVLGEGVYTLKDDLHLATPPLHPSEAPIIHNNPLVTTIGPVTSGVKLSVAVQAQPRPPSSSLFRTATRSTIPHSIEEETQSPHSEAGSATNGFGTASYYAHVPGFGDNNPALATTAETSKTKAKKDQKSKPKNNILKSNSAFISRAVPLEALQKRLQERGNEGTYAFANISRAFLWLDLSSETKTDPLLKVLFTKANVLCHDVNALGRSSNHLDVIMGFNTGDIIWYEPFSQKYSRINKNDSIISSQVLAISWLPQRENLFVAAHKDGTLIVYDKEREDPEKSITWDEEIDQPTSGISPPDGPQVHRRFRVKKSVQSRNQKTNPVAAWKFSHLPINALAFSPDGALLALVSEDGTLSIFDYIHERLIDVFRSYYGALTCVSWSPDGQYLLTGGQDDLVSIWSVADKALVARGVGHQSWITGVQFDPWRCDGRNYRFGSVGEDGRLLLWDFSVGMLGRPAKASAAAAAARIRGSVGGGASRMGSVATVSPDTAAAVAETAGASGAEGGTLVHAVEGKASTPILPPIMSKQVAQGPVTWLGFEENCILTASKDGHIREWTRPATESL